MQCHGELAHQQVYLRQLLLGYVDVGPCERQDEMKSMGKSTDNSNASTDDEDAFVTAVENT